MEGAVKINRLALSSIFGSFRINRLLVNIFNITVIIIRFVIAEFASWIDLMAKKVFGGIVFD